MASKLVLLVDKPTQASLNLHFLLESAGCKVTFIEAFGLLNCRDGLSKPFDFSSSSTSR